MSGRPNPQVLIGGSPVGMEGGPSFRAMVLGRRDPGGGGRGLHAGGCLRTIARARRWVLPRRGGCAGGAKQRRGGHAAFMVHTPQVAMEAAREGVQTVGHHQRCVLGQGRSTRQEEAGKGQAPRTIPDAKHQEEATGTWKRTTYNWSAATPRCSEDGRHCRCQLLRHGRVGAKELPL